MNQLTAVGFTCGVGSMLLGARQAGFKVLGNIEWRKYYHHRCKETGKNTYEENFPGTIFRKSYDLLTSGEIADLTGCDIALGHPECGNYSILTQQKELKDKPGDIPVFIELVQKLKPRYFVQDNLPGALQGVSIKEWAEALPEYDIFPEWISNYHYGNIQKKRTRLFIIGALKSEKFVFQPGEEENTQALKDVLANIQDDMNHNSIDLSGRTSRRNLNMSEVTKLGEPSDEYIEDPTWEDVQKYFENKPEGHVMTYVNKEGLINRRVGLSKSYVNKHCHVITGNAPIINPLNNLPFTIRERARIQGAPDDFKFYGEKLPFTHDNNMPLVKQTGKFMPIQFCRFISEQIFAHINGQPFEASGQRFLKNNQLIDEAKQWYCENVGYENQQKVCNQCWNHATCERRQKNLIKGE